MKKLALVAAIALCGCTTLSGIEGRAPKASFATSREPAALEECLALKLSLLGTPSVIRGEHQTRLAWGNPNPTLVTSIAETAEGRHVEVRSWGPVSSRIMRRIEDCAKG